MRKFDINCGQSALQECPWLITHQEIRICHMLCHGLWNLPVKFVFLAFLGVPQFSSPVCQYEIKDWKYKLDLKVQNL